MTLSLDKLKAAEERGGERGAQTQVRAAGMLRKKSVLGPRVPIHELHGIQKWSARASVVRRRRCIIHNVARRAGHKAS